MVTIAIPVYNRLELLKIMADSFYNMDIPFPYNIRIYDDCSTEYDSAELKNIFPNAYSIKRNENNLKADMQMYSFYKDFLSTNDKYLFNADSDIIFNKKCLVQAMELIQQTDGILSVFNATSHLVKRKVDENLCIKETIGAAGTFFTRNRVEEIIAYFSSLDSSEIVSFDWKWCEFFTKKNIRIFCTNNSLIQHIGYYGQNSVIGYKGIKTQKPYFDFGKGFQVDSSKTGQIINDIFEKLIDQNRIEDVRLETLLSQRPLSKLKMAIKRYFIRK